MNRQDFRNVMMSQLYSRRPQAMLPARPSLQKTPAEMMPKQDGRCQLRLVRADQSQQTKLSPEFPL